jgi:hypothetical protein
MGFALSTLFYDYVSRLIAVGHGQHWQPKAQGNMPQLNGADEVPHRRQGGRVMVCSLGSKDPLGRGQQPVARQHTPGILCCLHATSAAESASIID